MPALWELIDSLPLECRPHAIRGDCNYGKEANMVECEKRGIPYLFKLRQTGKVKNLISLLEQEGGWVDCGQGFEGIEGEVRLGGWSRKRRVIVARRLVKQDATEDDKKAVPVSRQVAINARNRQTPERRDIAALILKKSRSLLRHVTITQREQLSKLAAEHRISAGLAKRMDHIADESVQLVITSPPFLNVVNYRQDNWLRCWFAGIDPQAIPKLTSSSNQWTAGITEAMQKMRRVVKNGGHIAIEVGEVKKGAIKMEELVIEAGNRCGMKPKEIYLNTQIFTKTSHCWGIENNKAGTNTNRIVVFQK
jgi:hypothetical protein